MAGVLDIELIPGLGCCGDLIKGVDHVGIGGPLAGIFLGLCAAQARREFDDLLGLDAQARGEEVIDLGDITHTAAELGIIGTARQAILEIVIDTDQKSVVVGHGFAPFSCRWCKGSIGTTKC